MISSLKVNPYKCNSRKISIERITSDLANHINDLIRISALWYSELINLFCFLGRSGIICTEDLIHEIFTVGSKFKFASNFLWPFKVYHNAFYQSIPVVITISLFFSQLFFCKRRRHDNTVDSVLYYSLLLCRKTIPRYISLIPSNAILQDIHNISQTRAYELQKKKETDICIQFFTISCNVILFRLKIS